MIRQLIREQVISTQGELTEALRRSGFNVTQATVSRDIKEMGLVKASDGHRVRYLIPGESVSRVGEDRLRRLFRDYVWDVDYSDNLVLVKTLPGAAQGVASGLDGARWPQILGSVAGDDTILVVIKPKEKAREIAARLRSFIEG